MKLKTRNAQENQLPRIIKEFQRKEDELRAFITSHDEIFARYHKLQDDIEGMKERIKLEARKQAVLGQTVSVVDNEHVSVTVQGKVNTKYNYEAAKKLWPSNVLAEVSNISTTAVAAAIDGGLLPEELAAKCRVVEPATAAVTIKVKT